jgi:hypothetical protein
MNTKLNILFIYLSGCKVAFLSLQAVPLIYYVIAADLYIGDVQDYIVVKSFTESGAYFTVL